MQAEIADEEFQSFLRIARSLEPKLNCRKDRKFAKRLLKQCEKHNKSSYLIVKSNTNTFMKYVVKSLNWASNNETIQGDDKWCECLRDLRKIWLQHNVALEKLSDNLCADYCAFANSPKPENRAPKVIRF